MLLMNQTLGFATMKPFALAAFVFLVTTTSHAQQKETQRTPEFLHPGISHTQASIDFVKNKIAAGEEPWASAWKGVQGSRYADLNWRPQPRAHVERGPSNDPDIGSSEFSADASAAYRHALLWALTNEAAHAKKAAQILNAWSGTLQSISNHDARLLVGMEGYEYCNAAELLKHTWDGWPQAEQSQFEKMLRSVFYPVIKDFYPSANGNWDASMLQTMLAMGVYLDDRAIYDRGVEYYLHGKGNGAVRNYFKPSGQCQETGRDQAHTQMGLDFLACTCEIAWNQDRDLYGAYDNRLLKGFEYTAKYNLGFDVPYEPYRSFEGRYHYKSISGKSRGGLRPMYDKVLNHFQNRKGLQAEFTKQAAMKLRSNSDNQDSRERKNRGRRSRRSRSSALGTLMFSGQSSAVAADRPNIIIVMVDDMGYEGVSCFGNPLFETPQIDRLAAEGMRLTDFHSSGTVCSPTRAGLLTGRYQQRAGIEAVIHPKSDHPEHRKGLQENETTFAEVLKEAGYTTGIIGKWHQGYPQNSDDYHPQNHGFDEFIGYHSGNIDFVSHVGDHMRHDWWHGRDETPEDGYTTHLVNRYTDAFIRKHAKSEKPFCLYVAHEAIHNPVQVPGDPIRRTVKQWNRWKWQDHTPQERIEKFKGMTMPLDEGVGQLRRTLVELGIDNNTFVLFFSDNGPAGDWPDTDDFRGRKGSIYEGGHKVPAIAWWPGKIAAGSESDEPLISSDVMPTALQLAGANTPGNLDGISFADVFLSGKTMPKRPLFWASLSNNGQRSEAIREENWKLVVQHKKARPGSFQNPSLELYNLKEDPSEKSNVAKQYPDRAAAMSKRLTAWYEDTQATATKQPGGWPQ